MALTSASSIVISSDTGLLILLAIAVGALAFLVLRGTARAFGVITHPESTTLPELSEETKAALAENERRIMELLDRQLPDYATRYVAQRSEADDASLAQAIDIALKVAPKDGSPDTEVALALGELQAQIQHSHVAITALELSMTDNCNRIDTLSSRAITPERVTVIASGMAVGLVLLLCTFGALLVSVLNVSSASTSEVSDQGKDLGRNVSIEGSSNYCITPLAQGVEIVRRKKEVRC